MHEIITLQLGHTANYTATHFWNAQQAYFTYSDDTEPSPIGHDIHFRAGVGPHGDETYTARTLIYDLKGGFGSLRKINALYEVEGSDDPKKALWDNGVAITKQPQIEQNDFTKSLDQGGEPAKLSVDKVRYWSDFNTVYYHPRSIVQFYEYELGSALSPFEAHQHGRELFDTHNKEHDILDRDFRFFAEECDQMQGIQLYTATDDAWGGFASEYVASLRDEFPKAQIWTWGIERCDKVPREKRIPRMVSLASALTSIVPMASVYVPLVNPPLKFPSSVQLDTASQWHTSALLSAAIESASLQTRLKDRSLGLQMDDLSSMLNVSGSQNIASLSLSILDLDDEAEQGNFPDSGGTPNQLGDHRTGEHTGKATKKHSIHQVDLSWPGDERHLFASLDVYRTPNEPSVAPPSTKTKYKDAILGRYHTILPYPAQTSYPEIFKTRKTTPLSLQTNLRTSTVVMERLRLMKDVAMKYAGLEERETLKDELSSMYEAYQEGWSSDTDSGDED